MMFAFLREGLRGVRSWTSDSRKHHWLSITFFLEDHALNSTFFLEDHSLISILFSGRSRVDFQFISGRSYFGFQFFQSREKPEQCFKFFFPRLEFFASVSELV